jgi:hypothetical protein
MVARTKANKANADGDDSSNSSSSSSSSSSVFTAVEKEETKQKSKTVVTKKKIVVAKKEKVNQIEWVNNEGHDFGLDLLFLTLSLHLSYNHCTVTPYTIIL